MPNRDTVAPVWKQMYKGLETWESSAIWLGRSKISPCRYLRWNQRKPSCCIFSQTTFPPRLYFWLNQLLLETSWRHGDSQLLKLFWLCCTLLFVHSSIAIILMGKRELVALLNLSFWCLVMVERLFLAVPWGCLQFVIVVFPDHTHLLFLIQTNHLTHR